MPGSHRSEKGPLSCATSCGKSGRVRSSAPVRDGAKLPGVVSVTPAPAVPRACERGRRQPRCGAQHGQHRADAGPHRTCAERRSRCNSKAGSLPEGVERRRRTSSDVLEADHSVTPGSSSGVPDQKKSDPCQQCVGSRPGWILRKNSKWCVGEGDGGGVTKVQQDLCASWLVSRVSCAGLRARRSRGLHEVVPLGGLLETQCDRQSWDRVPTSELTSLLAMFKVLRAAEVCLPLQVFSNCKHAVNVVFLGERVSSRLKYWIPPGAQAHTKVPQVQKQVLSLEATVYS